MGAILKNSVMVTGLKTINNKFISIIDEDDKRIINEEDFYTGHFGATQQIVKSDYQYKGNKKDDLEKNMRKFLEDEEFEKYIIKYAIIGEIGYQAYKLKVIKTHNVNGKVILKYSKDSNINVFQRFDYIEFKNITELKTYLRNVSNPHQYLNADILNQKYNCVGSIGAEKRRYKTKPKTLPKKYDYLDKLVVIGYAAFNPY